MRVLIVEDEILIAMHLAMLVKEFGHDVCAIAQSAAGALIEAATHDPDVVLMDIRLANNSSGIYAAQQLHARQGLRCIFLSANLDEPTKTALLQCDHVDFIGKPVLPLLLQRALQRAEMQSRR